MNEKSRKTASLILGLAVMLFSGVFYAWNLFWREVLADQFPGWTSASVNLNLTLFIITFCLGGLVGGKLTPKLGQPKLARLGALFMAVGGVLFLAVGKMSESAALWMLYLTYGILCGIGEGMIYNAVISSVGSLFPKAGGLVAGALLMCFGLGSLVMGAAVVKLAAAAGFYLAFMCAALLTALTAFFAAPLFRPAPKPAAAPGAEAPAEGKNLTTGQMIRTPVFWFFFLWVVFMTSTGLMVISSSSSIAVLFGAAAILGTIVSVFNGVSRSLIGAFCDRFGSSASMLLSNGIGIVSGLALLIAAGTNSTALMIIGLIAAGITYGCGMSMNAVVVREEFGSANYPSNFSMTTLSGIPASLLGPLVSGMLQDASGGYTTTFIAMIVISVLAFFMLLGILYSRKKDVRPE